MGRKKGFDNQKLGRIIMVLAGNPDGIWLRKLANEADMHPLTASKYIEGVLKPIIEEVSLETGGKSIIRVIKLKNFIIEQINSGKNLNEIIKKLYLLKKI